jgi:hypothetical protein
VTAVSLLTGYKVLQSAEEVAGIPRPFSATLGSSESSSEEAGRVTAEYRRALEEICATF